jgi:hypothetical protein
LRPGHLGFIQEGDRPLNNLAVDNSLTRGGFANHCGGWGDQCLDAWHADEVGRIRVRQDGAVGLNVPAGQDRPEAWRWWDWPNPREDRRGDRVRCDKPSNQLLENSEPDGQSLRRFDLVTTGTLRHRPTATNVDLKLILEVLVVLVIARAVPWAAPYMILARTAAMSPRTSAVVGCTSPP